eukprot:103765-Prymnesium_polylepis.1
MLSPRAASWVARWVKGTQARAVSTTVHGTNRLQKRHFCDVTSRGAPPCSRATEASAELLA